MLSILPPIVIKLLFFVAFVNSACVLVDTIMIRHHKSAIYYFLLHIWNKIDEAKLIDFPKITAKLTLEFKSFIFGSKAVSVRGVFSTILFSFILTTVALSADKILSGSILFFSTKMFFINIFYRHQMYMPVLYVTNLIYDVLTIAATTLVLTIIVKHGSSMKGFLLLWADALLAFVLAVFCLYTVIQISIEFNHTWVLSNMKADVLAKMEKELHTIENSGGIIINVADSLWSTIKALLTFGAKGNHYTSMSLASATTLAPTIVYINILIFLMIAKAIIFASGSSAKYIIEKATEPDIDNPNQAEKFMPFTIFGRIVSAFSSLIVVIVIIFTP